MKLSTKMFDALRTIAEHERSGKWGAPAEAIPSRTFVALARRGLVTSKPHHGIRCTLAGLKLVAGEEEEEEERVLMR